MNKKNLKTQQLLIAKIVAILFGFLTLDVVKNKAFADLYPHIPQYIIDSKSEKILPKLDIPSDNSANVSVFSIKKILKSMLTNIKHIKNYNKNEETILDSVSDILNIPINKNNFELNYINKESEDLPVVNKLPNFSYLYNDDTPVIKNIEDIKIKGLDDVLAPKIGSPLKPDNYIQTGVDYFNDFITPDDMLNTDVLDILP